MSDRREPLAGGSAASAASAEPALCDVIYESPVEVVATVGDCVVTIGPSALHPKGVRAIGTALFNLTQRYAKVNYFAIIGASKPDYPPESRSDLAKVIGKYTHNITGAALVCEGTGFRGTATRSIITAIHVASLAAHPLKVFSEMEPAVAWLEAKQTDGVLDGPALAAQIRTLRARFQ